MTIHREGKSTLIMTIIFLVILVGVVYRYTGFGPVFYITSALSMLFFIIILQFFRSPDRKISSTDLNDILSPADGKVVVIEDTIESEYFEDERLMISIFMSPINVHSNHHPVDGEITYSKYHPGKYLVAWHPKSSTENERFTTVYKSGKDEILVRQIAGALARRIVNYVKKGDEVSRGDELGFIKFGSRVDIYLPVGTRYLVTLGQQVRAKKDIIAQL